MSKDKKKMPLFLKILLWVMATIVVVFGVYAIYLFGSYKRIEDNVSLVPENVSSKGNVETGKELTIFTQNIGFGAYTSDYTFFMDGGTESWADSKESVIECVDKAGNKALSFDPDFVVFQEVDFDGTRSYHVDEAAALKAKLNGYSSVFAQNFDSAFLFYPFTEPHGKNKSGILTLSKYNITSGLRRSYPISDSITKILDLDRCFSISRIPTDNGKELVIYNSHLSAYGGSDAIHSMQLNMLFEDMVKEYNKGNYVVAGGDFNDDFTDNSLKLLDGLDESPFGWTMPFPEDVLPDGLSRCINYDNGAVIPTARNCDVPYKEGNFTVIVDGFVVSDNIEVTSVNNIDTGFEYSDHNPVVMKFVLR
ncbi:MAG: endonuclease/exonuclease/phosphatase family protein [Lachnospiraceae bacterium]|nr:endonuclease/exonuclease/phosphatase family protein [Lachnospiraceae bacterium]MBR5945386.1 endonuclease/exonuclease/phosphatase family protein [Lachnospiraceae bacterium]